MKKHHTNKGQTNPTNKIITALVVDKCRKVMHMYVYVVVQFGFWFNLDFPLFDIHYHILA